MPALPVMEAFIEVVLIWYVAPELAPMRPEYELIDERLGSVVMPEILVDALKRLSKSPLKVVVYTPFVTVPALPEISPAIVLRNVCVPSHVFGVEVPKASENTPEVSMIG